MADCEETPNLGAMTRDELNTYATEHGVADAESYANKDDLAAAIVNATATASAPDAGGFAAPQGETMPYGEHDAAPATPEDQGEGEG